MDTITKKFNLIMGPRTITDALGSKIIELDSIVISELIKNSKDANATKIIIDFNNYKNVVTFWDNGDGMDIEDIESKWGIVASNNKSENLSTLGGKGIGRFSILKLCNNFTIITKKSDSKELKFTFNIKDLYSYDSAEDYSINIIENSIPEIFKENSSSGTYIIMNEMNEINIDEIYNNTRNLILHNSNTNKILDIKYLYPSNFKLEPYIPPEKAIQFAPFHCDVTFSGSNILSYDFKVSLKNKLVHSSNDIEALQKEFSKIDSNFSLGKIRFVLSSFYFDRAFINHYKIDKNSLENNFLNYFCGISVYRKDFKIYGLGENDWLQLTERRLDNPSKRINNKQLYSYIILESPDSDLLEEKTSREGFIRSKYLDYLKETLMTIIKYFEKDLSKFRPLLYNKKEGKGIFDDLMDDSFSNGSDTFDNHGPSNGSDTSDNHTSSNGSDTSDNHVSSNDSDTFNNHDSSNGSDTSDNHDSSNSSENPNDDSNVKRQSPKPSFDKTKIIDSSFSPSQNAPEKIKKIIFELQKLNSSYINAQALLLRCLIDISTQYFAEGNNTIKISNSDLKANVLNVINYFSNSNILDKKSCDRLRNIIKKENVINYFNGVAHYYNYRPDFETVKSIWDAFEPYIEKCISK